MASKTALNEWHKAHGAKMIEFAQWDMPIQYSEGAVSEHRLVRTSAGIFDVSHMGQFRFTGTGAQESLNRLVTSNLSNLQADQSSYGLLCLPTGGIIDDVFVYRRSDHWLMVVNAANREKDLAWCNEHLGPATTLEDVSDLLAMFAFQGPQAIEIMDHLADGKVSAIPRFGAATIALSAKAGSPRDLDTAVPVEIGRTGYTGEDGVEIFVPAESAQPVWEMILAAAQQLGIACGPIGLAARDSLRFEPGFPLYGHELNEQITPAEARLKWACDFDTEFIGREAIRKRIETKGLDRLATIMMVDKGVPRQGFDVVHDETVVGTVASGMYCPTVDAYCANVFVPAPLAKIGKEFHIQIRSQQRLARIVKRPLYRPTYR